MDAREKSFDSARESSKLVIALATGVIAFTVTFAKELGGLRPADFLESAALLLAWGSLLVSTVVGVWTQLAITDVLGAAANGGDEGPTIRSRKIMVPFRWQLIYFLLGIGAMAVYGGLRILAVPQ